MSLRLNMDIREQILKNVVEATFRTRAAASARLEQENARYFRDFAMGDWLNTYNSLPPELQVKTNYYTIVTIGDNLASVDKLRTYLHFNVKVGFRHQAATKGRNHYWGTPGSSLTMVTSGDEQVCPIDIVHIDIDKSEHRIPLARLRAFYEVRKKLEEDVKVFSQRLVGVLRNVTTTKKLVEEWPEIQPHIPHVHKPIGFCIPRDELNSLISSMQSGTNNDPVRPGEVINL